MADETKPSVPTDDTSELRVSGEFKFRPLTITIKDPEDPDGKKTKDLKFQLRDVDGHQRTELQKYLSSAVKIDPATGKPISMEIMEGMDAGIIAYCMYKEGVPVGKDFIIKMNLPGQTLDRIARACIVLCSMDPGAAEREKNV